MLVLFLVLLDIVVTVDGRRIEGKVLREDERGVELRVKGGRIVIPRERVKEVLRCPTAEEEYRKRQEDVRDAEGHYRLGLWCLKKGLKKEAKEEFEAALRLEPDHTGAREALKKLQEQERRRRLGRYRDPKEATFKKDGRIPKEHRLWRLGEWRLSTDLPPERAQKLLKNLAEFLKKLRRFYPGMVRKGTEPMLVLLFSNHQSYREWLKKEKLERFADAYGCYSGRHRKSFVTEAGVKTMANLMHECMHQVWVERMKKRGVRTPMWLFEGMAEFAEGWWDCRKQKIVAGRVHSGNLRVLKEALKEGDLIDWGEFLGAEKFDELFKKDYASRKCYVAYAQAWGLYIYLVRRQKGRLMDYLRALAAGRKPDLAKIVPNLDKLQERLREFVASLR